MNLKACLSALLVSCALVFAPGTVKAETVYVDGVAIEQPDVYVSSSKTGIYIEPKIGFGIQIARGDDGYFGSGETSAAMTFVAGASVGYDWYYNTSVPIRTEFEYLYNTKASLSPWSDYDVDIKLQSFLINAYYDFRDVSNAAVPYVGLGLGVARCETDGDYGVSGSKTGCGMQIGAGCAFPLTEELAADVNLRWFLMFNSVTGSYEGVDIYKINNPNTLQVTAGLRFTF